MKIAVMGAAGRMGRELLRAIAATPGCEISGGTEPQGRSGNRPGPRCLHRQLAVSASLVSDDAASVIAAADAIIDFTSPAATVAFAKLAAASTAKSTSSARPGAMPRTDAAINDAAQARDNHQSRQHEPRRQSAGGPDQARCSRTRRRLRYRNCRNASPAESRCAVGHRLDAGRGRSRRPRRCA